MKEEEEEETTKVKTEQKALAGMVGQKEGKGGDGDMRFHLSMIGASPSPDK